MVGSVPGLGPGLGVKGVARQQLACAAQPCQRCQFPLELKPLQPLVICEVSKLRADCTRREGGDNVYEHQATVGP